MTSAIAIPNQEPAPGKNSAPRPKRPDSENNNFEPSSGGTGIKLNKANQIFTKTIKAKKLPIAKLPIARVGKNLIINPRIKAIRKFEPGPAKLTSIKPFRWSRKLFGLIGTGLA